MDDAEKEPREHQANRGFRIDSLSTNACRIEVSDLTAYPAEVGNTADAGKEVIVRDKVTQRSADEELQLISGSDAAHATLHMMSS